MDTCKAEGVPPPTFKYEATGLWVEFSLLGRTTQKTTQMTTPINTQKKLGEKLGKTRAAIVAAIQDDPKITVTKLAKTLKISTTAVEKNLQYLKSNGYVQRIGPAKGGHWEIARRKKT